MRLSSESLVSMPTENRRNVAPSCARTSKNVWSSVMRLRIDGPSTMPAISSPVTAGIFNLSMISPPTLAARNAMNIKRRVSSAPNASHPST